MPTPAVKKFVDLLLENKETLMEKALRHPDRTLCIEDETVLGELNALCESAFWGDYGRNWNAVHEAAALSDGHIHLTDGGEGTLRVEYYKEVDLPWEPRPDFTFFI